MSVPFGAGFTVFFVIFGIAFVAILATSVFVSFNVFRIFHRVVDQVSANAMQASSAEAEGRGRRLDKCRNCGAAMNASASVSPDGRVQCEYCSQWNSAEA